MVATVIDKDLINNDVVLAYEGSSLNKPIEHELFDFEHNSDENSDFFLTNESPQVLRSPTRFTRFIQWFTDQYEYALISGFIWYLHYKMVWDEYYAYIRKKIRIYKARMSRYLFMVWHGTSK